VVVPMIGVAVLAIPVWGDLWPGQASPYNTLPWLTTALIATGIIMLSRLQRGNQPNTVTRPRLRARAA
jgi:hypothetical protein